MKELIFPESLTNIQHHALIKTPQLEELTISSKYDLKGDKLSCLGLGCMRLPNKGEYNDIDEIDLACILGNILDNAVEAQKDVINGGHIELHFLQKNSNRVIVCKNTIAESVLQENKNLKLEMFFLTKI